MKMDQWLTDVRAKKHVALAEDCTWDDESVGHGGIYAESAGDARHIWEKIEPDSNGSLV